MKRALIAAVMLFIVAPPVASAPKAKTALECRLFADLALVASAAAKAGVDRKSIRAMLTDIYDLPTEDDVTLMRLIVGAVHGSAKGVEPTMFAGTLGSTCMRGESDMDSILGTGI